MLSVNDNPILVVEVKTTLTKSDLANAFEYRTYLVSKSLPFFLVAASAADNLLEADYKHGWIAVLWGWKWDLINDVSTWRMSADKPLQPLESLIDEMVERLRAVAVT